MGRLLPIQDKDPTPGSKLPQNIMDPDDKVAFLLELFPNENIELIYAVLLNNNCDVDESIKAILDKDYQSDHKSDYEYGSTFDHLVNTFPEVEIEAIEAFLLTQDESSDLKTIVNEFMKQFHTDGRSPVSARDRNLKMKLSDFNAILKTSSEELFDKRRLLIDSESKYNSKEFLFTCKQRL